MGNVVVICGFDVAGEMVAKFLSMPSVLEKLVATGSNSESAKYVAFDLDPDRVVRGSQGGYRVMYGDGSQPLVLRTAGVTSPRAIVLTYDDEELCAKSALRIREAFPNVPIISRLSIHAVYLKYFLYSSYCP